MKEYDISDEAGIAILETAIEAFDLMHEAQAEVDKQGLTVTGDRGPIFFIANPAEGSVDRQCK